MDVSSLFLIVTIFGSLLDGGYAHPFGACPYAFEQHGHNCYKVLAEQATWAEAKMYCKAIGGDLARITSEKEQTIIAGLVLKSVGVVPHLRFWLDGSDMLVRREWRWIGSNGFSSPFSYTNWLPGEPSTGLESCLEVRWDIGSKWNNLDCYVRLSFICQARASNGDVLKLTE